MNHQTNNKITFKKLKLLPLISLSLFSFAATAMVGQTTGQSLNIVSAPVNQGMNLRSSGRIIVKYKDEMPESKVSKLSAKSMQGISRMTSREVKYMRKLSSGAHLLKADETISTTEYQQLLNDISADPSVEYAEPDLLVTAQMTPNDSRYSEQWDFYDPVSGINLPSAWDMTKGAGVTVAVIDTGYRPHADLAANILPGYDMISDLDIAQDGSGRDADAQDPGDYAPLGCANSSSPNTPTYSSWHGTHVAGTIAAVTNNGLGIAGAAFGAKILPVRVLGRCGGYTSDVADGIIWAAGGNVSGVPTNANPARVINLSVGGTGNCSITQQNAINVARSLGVTVVVAAGNENQDVANTTPAGCSGITVVAATGRTGAKAPYSNFGALVDVAAPGGNGYGALGILSTSNDGFTTPGRDAYVSYQGTSQATPHVAAVAALMYSIRPSITPDEVESILRSTTRSFPVGCIACGTGIVDATAAVAKAASSGAITILDNHVAATGLSGPMNSQKHFTFVVPAGASNVSFNLSGGAGDADLYVKYGASPTAESFDCRPYVDGNEEVCNIPSAQAGTYYVMLKAYGDYSDVNLVANYTTFTSVTNTYLADSTAGCTGTKQCTKATWGIDINEGSGFRWQGINGGIGGNAELYVTVASPTGTRAMSLWVNGVRIKTLSTTAALSPRPTGSELGPFMINVTPDAANTVELRDTEGTTELDALRIRVKTLMAVKN